MRGPRLRVHVQDFLQAGLLAACVVLPFAPAFVK